MQLRASLGFLLALSALSLASAEGVEDLKGHKMPAFKMRDLRGKLLSNANLRGKVIVMDFWATWCGPCKKVSPVMEDLHRRFASKGVVVIGADSYERNPLAAARYIKAHGYTYHFTLDNDALARSLGATGIPAVLVIDKKGVVRATSLGFGPRTPQEIEDAVKSALKG